MADNQKKTKIKPINPPKFPPAVAEYLGKIAAVMDRSLPEDRLQKKLQEREEFRSMYLLWGAVFGAIMISMASLGFFYFSLKKVQPPKVFFVQKDGATVQFRPQQLPNYSSQAVESWALETVSKIYTFDFKNMQEQVGGAKMFFTNDGWNEFVNVWNTSSLKDVIMKNRVSPSVVPLSNPIIDWEGGEKGKYAWRVLVPVLLTFVGDAKVPPQKRLITIVMVQVPTTENPKGLGVTQFIDTPLTKKQK